jgi:DNA-binding LacI/PurR family transcriptional regulator
MILSLDYDDTYTRDPVLWDAFIYNARARGHTVLVVTMRYDVPHEADPVRKALTHKVDGFFFTGRKAKRPFMASKGVNVSVWIDDQPGWILTDAAG